MASISSWLNCAFRDYGAVYWVLYRTTIWLKLGGTESVYLYILKKKWRSGQVSWIPHRLRD